MSQRQIVALGNSIKPQCYPAVQCNNIMPCLKYLSRYVSSGDIVANFKGSSSFLIKKKSNKI